MDTSAVSSDREKYHVFILILMWRCLTNDNRCHGLGSLVRWALSIFFPDLLDVHITFIISWNNNQELGKNRKKLKFIIWWGVTTVTTISGLYKDTLSCIGKYLQLAKTWNRHYIQNVNTGLGRTLLYNKKCIPESGTFWNDARRKTGEANTEVQRWDKSKWLLLVSH